jgi:hypothetical protein
VPAPEALDDFLARGRPELAGGAWVDAWLADRALPDSDLLALKLDLRRRRDGKGPAGLLRNERFRRLIGVNRHAGEEWFNKERFERAVAAIPMAAAERKKLRTAAEKSGYRVDRLVAALEPAARAKSAAKSPPKSAAKSPSKSAAKSPPKSAAKSAKSASSGDLGQTNKFPKGLNDPAKKGKDSAKGARRQ